MCTCEFNSVCEFPLYTHICYDKDMESVFVNITPLPPRLLGTCANIMIRWGRCPSHGLKIAIYQQSQLMNILHQSSKFRVKYLVILQF